MKTKKKMVVLGMSLFIMCGALTSAFASTYEEGTIYQTVTHKDVPNHGQAHYDTYYGSKKMTTGGFATVYKTHGDAALGNFGGLIDSSKSVKSEIVGLPLNTPNLASELNCKKGVIYFSVVTSSGLEPSNKCDVTMKFSADNLK